jgi:hypothetical protein
LKSKTAMSGGSARMALQGLLKGLQEIRKVVGDHDAGRPTDDVVHGLRIAHFPRN